MKKICPLALSCIIFLLSFGIFSTKIYAADSLSASSSSQQASEINYELPYPGLLPDSSLYIFRVIRDRIVGFLISDPLKKSEFDLLQSDKRLNAGIILLNKGKTSLSLETISKAGNYFDEALGEVEKAKMQGMNVTGFGNTTDYPDKYNYPFPNRTIIIVHAGKPYAMQYLMALMQFSSSSQVVMDFNPNAAADIVVALGYDWAGPP